MDKPRNQPSPDSPALSGPDYFSLVIEWDSEADQLTAAPMGDLEDEVTDRQIRHWDVVDEAGAESFPASDPPSWGSSHAAPTQATAAALDCGVQAIAPQRWIRQHAKQLVVALAAAGTLFATIHKIRRRSLFHAA